MQRLFPFLFVFFLFLDPLYMGLCSITGIQNDGIVLRLYLTVVFFVSFLSYWKIKSYVGFTRDINLFLILISFGALYFLTSQIYGIVTGLFLGHFLRWGAQCVPAVLMGVTFINYENKEEIYKYIPFIVIFLTIFITTISMSNNATRAQYVDEISGLNYQLVSYYMALLFTTTLFYQFIRPCKMRSKILSIIMYCMMAVQGVACTMSGGRGGFILLVVYIVFMLFVFLKKNVLSVSQILILIVFSVVVFILIANYVNLWDSAGFQRTIHPLQQNTEGRLQDWKKILEYFWNSPFIGNGIGSDFYTLGFYSHNIIIDFLVETGIIGCGFLILWFYKIEKFILYNSIYSDIMTFISIFAIYGLVMNCFSGYWISTYYHWLVLGVYYGLKTREVSSLP